LSKRRPKRPRICFESHPFFQADDGPFCSVEGTLGSLLCIYRPHITPPELEDGSILAEPLTLVSSSTRCHQVCVTPLLSVCVASSGASFGTMGPHFSSSATRRRLLRRPRTSVGRDCVSHRESEVRASYPEGAGLPILSAASGTLFSFSLSFSPLLFSSLVGSPSAFERITCCCRRGTLAVAVPPFPCFCFLEWE